MKAARQASGATMQARIHAAMPSLRPMEARVAQLVLDQPEVVIYQSISEVAAAVEVSTATVVRCAQKLGLKGFHELKLGLARDLALADHHREEATTPQTVLARVTAAGAQIVKEAGTLVSLEVFEEAVAALARAERVVFIGTGTSAALAQDAAYRFRTIGLQAEAPSDAHLQHVAARQLGPNGVCVAISYTGSTREMLIAVDAAHAAGARTIAITSFLRTPLTEAADLTLLVGGQRDMTFRLEAMVGHLAYVAIVEALIVAVAEQDEARAQAAHDLFMEVVWEHLMADRRS